MKTLKEIEEEFDFLFIGMSPDEHRDYLQNVLGIGTEHLMNGKVKVFSHAEYCQKRLSMNEIKNFYHERIIKLLDSIDCDEEEERGTQTIGEGYEIPDLIMQGRNEAKREIKSQIKELKKIK